MFVVPYVRPVHRLAAPQFSRYLDRFFDDAFDRADVRTPALDVSETDAAYIVSFDLPGATREQLKVTAEGRRVTVETVAQPVEATKDVANGASNVAAQDAAPETPKEADRPARGPRVLYRERSAVRYARTVSLPAEVDQAASSAKFENGVLTLTLAKKMPAGARQIAIG